MFQRDLELPWRERFPTPNREHSKHVYENRGVPSRRLRLLLPPTQPRFPRHTADGEQPKKGQAQGRRSQHPKIRAPLSSSSAGSGGQTKRGREGSHPKYCSREAREARPWDASHATSSPLALGVRLASAGRREKKNKQNKTKQKKIKTQQKQTEPQRNATRQPQAGGPSREEGGGAGSPTPSTAFGSFLPPRYLAILIPLWKFSQDISFSSRSPPREPWTGNFF